MILSLSCLQVRPSHVTNPKQCLVLGEGVERNVAGETASFQIIAVDKKGNSCVKGGEIFSVVLELNPDTIDKVPKHQPSNASGGATGGATGLSTDPDLAAYADIVDNNDGTYSVSYQVDCAGCYTMTVSHTNGIVCERNVKIVPAEPHASGCDVIGYDKVYEAGKSARFLVLLADMYGNRIRLCKIGEYK